MNAPLNQEIVNDTAKLIMHRLVARELARDPSVLDRAHVQLTRMAERYPEQPWVGEWAEILRRPIAQIAAFLISRDERAVRLRLSSPFTLGGPIDFKDEATRRRIWRAARRVAIRGAAATGVKRLRTAAVA
ncbi:MAG TPA: hypothetical protein VKX28_32150 [Xanthobacteraceae bacterium]|nr:hypothetical protein [Xanthobacteraceae bacterium]